MTPFTIITKMNKTASFKNDFDPNMHKFKKNYKRVIMQLFSADVTIFLKNFQLFFAHENMKNSL